MELGCGKSGTSRRAVWRPGALRAFSLQRSPGSRETDGPGEAHRLGRVRGEQSGQDCSALPLGKWRHRLPAVNCLQYVSVCGV